MSQQHMLALWIILLFSRGSTASSNVSSPSPERAVITMPTGVADVRTPAPPLHSSTASSNAFLPSNETATPTSDNTTTVPVTTNVTEVLTSVPPSHKDLRVISQFPFSIEAVPPGPMAEGKDYSLSCHIEIFIPNFVDFTVEWFIGQDRLNTETVNSTMEAINATHSFLYTPLITHNGAQYQCVVQFQPPGETSPLQHRSNALNIYVYSGCPVEISPPSLVVRYGDSASATCRALVPISGMGWESTVGAVGLEEGVTELNWTVKELREWTMRPQCFINPEDGDQCQKELAVVVYKMPDSVTLTIGDPGPKDAGTTYILTCRIENFTPVQNLNVRWFKGQVLVQEVGGEEDDSIGPQNKTYERQLIFKPSDNGAEYRCEAGLNLTSDPHIQSQPVLVTVHYPPSDSEGVSVLELERDTTLNCTADANPPPSYTWKTSGTHEKMGKTPVLPIDVAGNYTCTASNRLGSGTKHFIVVSRSSGTFWAIIGTGIFVIFVLCGGYGILKWRAGANSII